MALTETIAKVVDRELADALKVIDYKVDVAIAARTPFLNHDRIMFAWRVLQEGGYPKTHEIYIAAENIIKQALGLSADAR